MVIKKNILLFMLIFFQTIHSEIPLCISLGRACGPALNLRELKIRNEAYPFDWITSPFESLCEAIENDFSAFLTDIHLRPDFQGIFDYYGFHFTHDLPTVTNNKIDALNTDFVGNDRLDPAWERALPDVKLKYARRIERFRSACSGRRKIIFFRTDELKENIILLRDLIQRIFPELNFVLVSISNQQNHKEQWHIDHIKNFYCDHWLKPAEWLQFLKQTDPAFNSLVIRKSDLPNALLGHEACCAH